MNKCTDETTGTRYLLGKLTWMVPLVAIATMCSLARAQQNGRAVAETQERGAMRLAVQVEPTYMEKPLSYWLKSIQNRDSEMELAFDAIRALGPDARAAVPELTEIVAGPFTPVQIGVDKRDLMLSKLFDVQLRADAIDALGAIGEAAAPSSETLIQWAITIRVIPGNMADTTDQARFINLVTMDVLERMRVAGAVARFGEGAIPAIVRSLASSDDEKRKLAVAILDEKALPIAASLLKSTDCDERQLGIAILSDMWPVMPKDHLAELKRMFACGRDVLTRVRQVIP